MNYQVPQFIEVEDKLFGPLTLKQFIYLAGGIGISFAVYRFSPSLIITLPIVALVLAFSSALAFYKVHPRMPFISFLEAGFRYMMHGKLYLWKKIDKVRKTTTPAEFTGGQETRQTTSPLTVPKLTESKLKDLAWSLDVKESIYSNYNNKQ